MSNRDSQYSYGGGRYFLARVDNRKDDPEQSGRLRVQRIGHQESLQGEELQWARPIGSTGAGAIGGIMNSSPLGAMENSTVVCQLLDGAQQPVVVGSIGAAGSDESGSGQLDQKDRNAALPWHSRDESHGGGDFRFFRPEGENQNADGPTESGKPSDSGKRDTKGMTQFAEKEAPNPWKRDISKDSDDKGFTIGEYLYA